MPLVSVVMPVFNGERFLADAIESILAQTFTDFELLIVDDGSQDGSAEIVRAYANRDERVRLLQLERNAGFGTARNYGIKASNGKYITGMDCDDISLPQRLQRQVHFMRANPEVGALGTNMQATTENLKPLVPYYHPQQHAAIVCGIFLGTSLAGPTVMHRRESLESIGGYETGRRTSDDIELFPV